MASNSSAICWIIEGNLDTVPGKRRQVFSNVSEHCKLRSPPLYYGGRGKYLKISAHSNTSFYMGKNDETL